MRTSDSCRKEAPSLRRGFTLLELLIVLALLGLATAIAMPNLERLYASATRASERDYVLDQVAALGREAMLNGRAYVVFGNVPPPGPDDLARQADYETYLVDIPEGWRLQFERPLFVLANGVCLGGAFTLSHERNDATPVYVELAPPYCRVDVEA